MANDGFEDISKDFDKIIKNTPAEIEKIADNAGNNLLGRVKLNNPKAKKNSDGSREAWAMEKTDKFERLVKNPKEYLPNVEYGHRTRQGTGKAKNYRPKLGGISFIPPIYLLKRSVEEVEKDLDREFDIFIKNIWG